MLAHRSLCFVSAMALSLLLPPAVTAQAPSPKPKNGQIGRVLIPLGPLNASDLIDRWAKAAHKIAVVAPEVTRVRIEFTEAGDLTFDEVRALLAFHQVVVHEREGLLLAHHKRNLHQRVQPTRAPVLGPGDPLPREHRLVTAVTRIRHGDGNQIFAALRGLMARDTARLGSILWLPGSESIVIHDVTTKVAYYRKVLKKLDRPAASPRLAVTVYELPRSEWRALRRKHNGSALAAAVAQVSAAGSGRVLEELELSSLGGRFRSHKRIKIQDRTLELTISTRAVHPKGHTKIKHLQLDLDLKTTRPEGSAQRQVSTPLPIGSFAGRTRISSFTLTEGTQPTQLVLVLRGQQAR